MTAEAKVNKLIAVIEKSFLEKSFEANKKKILGMYNSLNATSKKSFAFGLDEIMKKDTSALGFRNYLTILTIGVTLGIKVPLNLVMYLDLEHPMNKLTVAGTSMAASFFACKYYITRAKQENKKAQLPINKYFEEIKTLLKIKSEVGILPKPVAKKHCEITKVRVMSAR